MLKGEALDGEHISCAGHKLRCSGDRLVPGRPAAISVRQHVMRLCERKPATMDNVLAGTVVRQVFLGPSRDYLVELPDATQLRVVASAAENIPQGSPIWLYLPPDRCRVLSG